jgi:hypothetical protein
MAGDAEQPYQITRAGLGVEHVGQQSLHPVADRASAADVYPRTERAVHGASGDAQQRCQSA